MVFHTVAGALRWYAGAGRSDGVRAIWPDPQRVSIPRGRGPEVSERLLTALAIERALGRLPAPQQRVLVLYYLEALPVIDIAARWDRHPSRIYAQLSNATKRLAGLLEAEGLLPEREPERRRPPCP